MSVDTAIQLAKDRLKAEEAMAIDEAKDADHQFLRLLRVTPKDQQEALRMAYYGALNKGCSCSMSHEEGRGLAEGFGGD